MGASVALPERRPPAPVRTPEMGVVPERDLLEVLPRLGTADPPQPMGVGDAARAAALRKTFPEFAISSPAASLLSALRVGYSGEPRVCCAAFGLSHYWEGGGARSATYRDGAVLRTCDPARFDAGACDDVLFQTCASGMNDMCEHWINAAFARRADRRSAGRLSAAFERSCAADASRPHCVAWIRALRSAGTPENDARIDAVLMAQTPEFKGARMRCSYPSPATLEMAAYVDEPRECWDPECVAGDVDFMLSGNYTNLGLCRLTRCSIGVTHLRMDPRSRLRMRCANALNAELTRAPVNQAAVAEANVRGAFQPRVGTLGVLALCVVYLLIVWL